MTSDTNNILEILYSLKKDILFTQHLILEDRILAYEKGDFIKNALAEIKREKERIEIAYKLIQEKFPDFKCPDEYFRTEKITETLGKG